ncbi:MAG: hypothetical protein AB7I27_07630 [Bacteriovoracaceae bacterium]
MSLQCYKCGNTLNEAYKLLVSRSDTCSKCMSDIRCCKNCQFYDPQSYNECRESSADRITDKEKANFCDFFKLGSSFNDAEKQKQEMLAKAAALFKK